MHGIVMRAWQACAKCLRMFRGLRNRWQVIDEERLSSSSRARKRARSKANRKAAPDEETRGKKRKGY